MCDFHDAVTAFHDGDPSIDDADNITHAGLWQALKDIGVVWMDTAGSVVCNTRICRKHGAKTALGSLYCKDPTYTEKLAAGKRAHKSNALYSHILSNDWGIDSSNMRDDDMKLIVKMFRGLLADDMPGMTQLFHSRRTAFTDTEINTCLGLSTMTDNGLAFFKGNWWQWRKKDNIRSLLDAHPPVVNGLDRLTNTKDYGPHGLPETRTAQEAAGDPNMAVDDRAGSADTLPDDAEGPALGAYGFMFNARC